MIFFLERDKFGYIVAVHTTFVDEKFTEHFPIIHRAYSPKPEHCARCHRGFRENLTKNPKLVNCEKCKKLS